MTSKEHYSFSEGVLEIRDPELGIEIKTVFQSMLLGDTIEEGYDLGEGYQVRVVRQGKDTCFIRRAYVEKEGKPCGQARIYYPNGERNAEFHYAVNDSGESLLCGPSRYYSSDGKLISEAWYVEGMKVGREKRYYSSGKIYCHIINRKGPKEGVDIYYYENGDEKTILPYKNDKLHGTVLLYHSSGQLLRSIPYYNGVRNGEEKEYAPSGIMIAKRLYDDNSVSEESYWSPRNILIETRKYHPGTDVKDVKKWDSLGVLRVAGFLSEGEYRHKEWDLKGKVTKEYIAKVEGSSIVIDDFIFGKVNFRENKLLSGPEAVGNLAVSFEQQIKEAQENQEGLGEKVVVKGE